MSISSSSEIGAKPLPALDIATYQLLLEPKGRLYLLGTGSIWHDDDGDGDDNVPHNEQESLENPTDEATPPSLPALVLSKMINYQVFAVLSNNTFVMENGLFYR